MRFFLLLFTVLLSSSLAAQPATRIVAPASWPAAIPYKGQPVALLTWQQPDGTHYLSLCSSSITEDEEGSRSQYLYALHAIVSGDSVAVVWKMQDYVQDCPVDVVCRWVDISGKKTTPSFVQLTDLDSDGEPEIWLLYRTACHGDVSPADQKLLMYDGAQKHALRGTTKLQVGSTLKMGGDYKADAAMLAAPAALRARASQLWQQFGSLKIE
ncbi:MAG: hypothetical protein MUF62_01740 [Chitinophagaceae bacterium]|nr:hypothetical protein [Chitinophagaceae bacterium]